MSNPTVACILLTKDRPEMAARAVRCFREQTYEHKRLLIINQAGPSVLLALASGVNAFEHMCDPDPGWTIGALRNHAMRYVKDAGIIAHWDDDDWSHPNRLAEQVALLQASGADLVGYNECLFWDTRPCGSPDPANNEECHSAMAWLYRYPNPRYCLGSSLLYWRKTWERQPFDDVNHGEDERFRLKVKSVGISAVSDFVFLLDGQFAGVYDQLREYEDYAPRMICAIHGGNTSHYAPEHDRAMWRRAENWDATCERMMKL